MRGAFVLSVRDQLEALINEYGFDQVREEAAALFQEQHVKFISYSGQYPALCRGVLRLEIDGIEYSFGWGEECNFRPFIRSGGCARTQNDLLNKAEVIKGPWIVEAELLPLEFKPYANEIALEINRNIEQGCCGGCVYGRI